MELRKTADGETFIIELEKEKIAKSKQVKKSTFRFFGLFGIGISLLLCITIVGIIPGFGLFLISLLFLYGARHKQMAEYPNCNHEQFVYHNTGNFICDKCKKRTVIEWQK
ncbi:TPA: hypothetical protein R9Y23_004511 [Bacillus cereus]|nr:hypothetical protein [Bacillus cereus]HEF1868273.1 hypothetical protein [Bacillus cereus]HEF1876452.1 hypothetical protein [Bacillus cereus]HEF1884859.1 hypothetical protein [Bacillus cereus]